MAIISKGFQRRRAEGSDRLPPGQYKVSDWPVLSAGPTPRVPLERWEFRIEGLVEQPTAWTWDEFMKLPRRQWQTDIHCVTHWSKLGTNWEGVSLDYLLEQVNPRPTAAYLLAYCYGGYTTNLPLRDVINQQAMVAFNYENSPLPPEHGGPARLLVPHLYFWKSAKWIQGLKLLDHDQLGFWEVNGYHAHGDPWKEERYSGD
jgi:DMSO/TMAO reductase YedYZ molybdopterin-dependent catalytic subunit